MRVCNAAESPFANVQDLKQTLLSLSVFDLAARDRARDEETRSQEHQSFLAHLSESLAQAVQQVQHTTHHAADSLPHFMRDVTDAARLHLDGIYRKVRTQSRCESEKEFLFSTGRASQHDASLRFSTLALTSEIDTATDRMSHATDLLHSSLVRAVIRRLSLPG